jgi:hypothetical protein
MTWNELRQTLRALAGVEIRRDDADGLIVSFAEHGQGVHLSVLEGAGERWLCLLSPIGRRGDVPAAAALAHNGVLLVGALCTLGNSFALRHVMPLQSIDEAALGRALNLLATEATRLRALLLPPPGRRQGDVAPFHIFAD